MPYYLASYPRSGNTLVRLILQRHFDIPAPSTYEIDSPWAPWLYELLPHLPDKEEGIPSFWKTHAAPPEGEPSKGIVVVRDGRDAIVSYAHFILDYGKPPPKEKFQEILLALCRGTWHDELPTWTTFHQQWLTQDVVMLRYEDLCRSEEVAVGSVQDALQRLLGRSVQRLDVKPQSFEQLHEIQPAFFRRGRVGSWRDELSPALEEIFWQTHGSMMTILHYGR